MSDQNFLEDDLDDEKTIAVIQGYLPQDYKDSFTEDELYYFLDLIDEYYMDSGILDGNTDQDGFIEINLEEIVEFIQKESKKDDMGEFDADALLFVVQGEMEYGNTLGQVD